MQMVSTFASMTLPVIVLERESLDSEEIARILRTRPFSEAPAPA